MHAQRSRDRDGLGIAERERLVRKGTVEGDHGRALNRCGGGADGKGAEEAQRLACDSVLARKSFTAAIGDCRLGMSTPSNLTKMIKSVKIGSLMGSSRSQSNAREGDRNAKIKHLSVREVGAFPCDSSANLRDQVLFHLIYRYALRRTEACLIQLDDFDFRANLFKSIASREASPIYPLFPDTKRLVRKYLDQPRSIGADICFESATTRKLFCIPRRAPLPAVREGGGPPRDRSNVHVLRHSFGMHMQEGERWTRYEGLDGPRFLGVDQRLHSRHRKAPAQKHEEADRVGEIA
jgi:integrase